MNLLQIQRKSRFIVTSLIASLATVACSDSGSPVEPVDELAPKLIQESTSQWRLDGKGNATIVIDGHRVRIVAEGKSVELPAEMSALLSRALANLAKGDSLVARQVGAGRYLRKAANAAELEKARQTIAAYRARRQQSTVSGIASLNGCGGGDMRMASAFSPAAAMCEDPCLDLGIALYGATETWRGKRDGVAGQVAYIVFMSAADYLWNQSVPGIAALASLAWIEAELAAATLEMEFIQIEFGLNNCFSPYE